MKKENRILGYWIAKEYGLSKIIAKTLKTNSKLAVASLRNGSPTKNRAIKMYAVIRDIITAYDPRNKNLKLETFLTEMNQEEAKKYFY